MLLQLTPQTDATRFVPRGCRPFVSVTDESLSTHPSCKTASNISAAQKNCLHLKHSSSIFLLYFAIFCLIFPWSERMEQQLSLTPTWLNWYTEEDHDSDQYYCRCCQIPGRWLYSLTAYQHGADWVQHHMCCLYTLAMFIILWAICTRNMHTRLKTVQQKFNGDEIHQHHT